MFHIEFYENPTANNQQSGHGWWLHDIFGDWVGDPSVHETIQSARSELEDKGYTIASTQWNDEFLPTEVWAQKIEDESSPYALLYWPKGVKADWDYS